ncbi:MAG: hypothetical protein HY729_13845 [Candidatus Rokubacteria bacterium]|nr:hypothetical protein [Candidatus Rokubacteria bacterium]
MAAVVLKAVGLGESRIGELIADSMARGRKPTVGTLAHAGQVGRPHRRQGGDAGGGRAAHRAGRGRDPQPARRRRVRCRRGDARGRDRRADRGARRRGAAAGVISRRSRQRVESGA